ncbi:MAG: prepilin-type N-terminal cleavage/methylation domain-containing protein [Bacillota bacterium]
MMKAVWNRHRKDERGFTLIELLAVVAILGILATIALPRVMSAITNSKAGKGSADVKTIESALEQFFLKYGRYPLDLQMLVQKGFLKSDFVFRNGYNNWYFFAVNWDGVASTNATKYVLGDPGQTPVSPVPGNLYGAGALPPGLDPTANTSYYWGAAAPPAAGVADADIAYYDNGVLQVGFLTANVVLTAVGGAMTEPTNTALKKP